MYFFIFYKYISLLQGILTGVLEFTTTIVGHIFFQVLLHNYTLLKGLLNSVVYFVL